MSGSVESHITIRTAPATELYALYQAIPEFHAPYDWNKWQNRLADRYVLALLADYQGTPAGIKIGYDEKVVSNTGGKVFYSWIGGVLPAFRQRGIAASLAAVQEETLRAQGFDTVRMKTRNRYKAMLIFALGNQFNITQVSPVDNLPDWRISLEKKI